MEYSYSFYIKDVVGNNEIRVILKNLDGSLKVRTLGDLQNYILHSKNYFKFTYNHNRVTYITCGKNLDRRNSSRNYFSEENPPSSENCGRVTSEFWTNLLQVEEIQFPTISYQEKEQEVNTTPQSPIDIMLANTDEVYVVDDGTGKIYFTIFNVCNNSKHQYLIHFKYQETDWQLVSNIPRAAYPGTIANMKQLDFYPDTQWLIDVVKSGAEFRLFAPTDQINLEAIKKLLPKGWTLNQYDDHVVIK